LFEAVLVVLNQLIDKLTLHVEVLSELFSKISEPDSPLFEQHPDNEWRTNQRVVVLTPYNLKNTDYTAEASTVNLNKTG